MENISGSSSASSPTLLQALSVADGNQYSSLGDAWAAMAKADQSSNLSLEWYNTIDKALIYIRNRSTDGTFELASVVEDTATLIQQADDFSKYNLFYSALEHLK